MNASLSSVMPAPRSLSAGSFPYLFFGFLIFIPMAIWALVALQRVSGPAWVMVSMCVFLMAAVFYWIGYYRVILTNENIFYRTLFHLDSSIAFNEIERVEVKKNLCFSMFGSGKTLLVIPKIET